MARIRSVKPELRRDLTVAEWPRDCRYAWVLLWGYLDDHGRGLDDLRLLTADLFPLDRDVTERKLDAWLRLMATPSTHGDAPLCRYTIGGRRFLHAPKWNRSQRVSHPQDSKIPPCPVHESNRSGDGTTPDLFGNHSGTVPDPFQTSRAPEDLGVKGARDLGVKGARDGFAEFWQIYPRREGKQAAAKAFDKATRSVAPEVVIAGAARFRDDPNRVDEFTPHPSTWLNQGRWDDDPLPARGTRVSATDAAVGQGLALVEHFRTQEQREIGA